MGGESCTVLRLRLMLKLKIPLKDSTSSYKIDYNIMIKAFLNTEGHQNPFCGSKKYGHLTEGVDLASIGGVALGRVCASSLHNRLVFTQASINPTKFYPKKGVRIDNIMFTIKKCNQYTFSLLELKCK